MENQSYSYPALFTFLLLIFMVLKIWKKSKINSSTPKLPPGPWKLPLIGSMHLLVGSLPHHRLRDLAKKHGPIMHLKLGEVTNIVVSSPEIAKEVMKTHDIIFAQRPTLLAPSIMGYNCIDITFSPYGDYWRQLRKICTLELLTAKRVQSFGLIKEEEVSKLIVSLSATAGSPINFTRMFCSMTFSMISRTAFGKIWKGEEIFLPAFKKLEEAGSGFNVVDLYPSVKLFHVFSSMRTKLERLHQEVDKLVQEIIDDHRVKKTKAKSGVESEEDIIDVLLKVQEQGNLQFPLTDDSIKAVILDIFAGGTETSSTTVVWAMSEMLKNPIVLEKAQAEVRNVFNKKGYVDGMNIGELYYMKAIVKETLRLHPPLPLLPPKECKEKCVINGYDVPAKSRAIVNVWAIGRDPNYWSEPEIFYPDRFLDCSIDYKGTDFEFLPFGGGRRICPGILLGLSNVEFPLAQLLYQFDWKLPAGINSENLDMTEEFGSVATRKNDLHLIPMPYLPQLVK